MEQTIHFIYLIFTFFYGTIFTLLFLDIRCSRKNTVILVVFSAASLVLQVVAGLSASLDTVDQYYPLFVHLPLLLLCIFAYRQSPLRSVSSILMCYFLMSPRYVLAWLITFLFRQLPAPELTGRIIATLPLIFLTWKFALNPIRASLQRSKHDIFLFFVPLTAIYALSYLLFVYSNALLQNPRLAAEWIVTLLFCMLLYLMRLYFVTFDKKKELEIRTQLIDTATSALKSRMYTIKNANEETRILRHDMRHYNSLIAGYAKEGNTEKILECTQALETAIEARTTKNYCKNTAVNLILGSYLAPFEAASISTNVHANVPEQLSIPETELCIILANAIENSYHAIFEDNAANSSRLQPFLSIEINTLPDRLYIKIENSCYRSLVFEDGIPVALQSGHGLGTKSIAAIAKKYGIYSFALTDHVFTLKVILHYPQLP